MALIPKKNSNNKSLQCEIFESSNFHAISPLHKRELNHSHASLTQWRKNIYEYQNKVTEKLHKPIDQTSLFRIEDDLEFININPFSLTKFSINFWRSNKIVDKGPAMYFVIDTIKTSKIILYIGETNSADKRWKGEHDCKNYLSNYSDSLQKANMMPKLNIRFWLDVPIKTKERRKLEQKLIQTWLPPFNKETRGIWATPFTS